MTLADAAVYRHDLRNEHWGLLMVHDLAIEALRRTEEQTAALRNLIIERRAITADRHARERAAVAAVWRGA